MRSSYHWKYLHHLDHLQEPKSLSSPPQVQPVQHAQPELPCRFSRWLSSQSKKDTNYSIYEQKVRVTTRRGGEDEEKERENQLAIHPNLVRHMDSITFFNGRHLQAAKRNNFCFFTSFLLVTTTGTLDTKSQIPNGSLERKTLKSLTLTFRGQTCWAANFNYHLFTFLCTIDPPPEVIRRLTRNECLVSLGENWN